MYFGVLHFASFGEKRKTEKEKFKSKHGSSTNAAAAYGNEKQFFGQKMRYVFFSLLFFSYSFRVQESLNFFEFYFCS